MRKTFTILVVILFVASIGICIYIISYEPPQYSDFGVFESLQKRFLLVMKEQQGTERPVPREFKDFALEFSMPWTSPYGRERVGVYLKCYETDRLATATISQFVAPPKSDYYQDFTVNIRPRYGIKAPILSVNFIKPAAGNVGECTVDFLNVDTDTISTEQFLGKEIGKVQQALALVKKYQRTVEQGRGETTKYLVPWKSRYRLELKEPQTESKAVREKYYTTAADAIKLFLSAYMNSLNTVQTDAGYVKKHEEKTNKLILAMYAHDEAVSQIEKIFKKKFEKYWLDGVFNVQVKLKKN